MSSENTSKTFISEGFKICYYLNLTLFFLSGIAAVSYRLNKNEDSMPAFILNSISMFTAGITFSNLFIFYVSSIGQPRISDAELVMVNSAELDNKDQEAIEHFRTVPTKSN